MTPPSLQFPNKEISLLEVPAPDSLRHTLQEEDRLCVRRAALAGEKLVLEQTAQQAKAGGSFFARAARGLGMAERDAAVLATGTRLAELLKEQARCEAEAKALTESIERQMDRHFLATVPSYRAALGEQEKLQVLNSRSQGARAAVAGVIVHLGGTRNMATSGYVKATSELSKAAQTLLDQALEAANRLNKALLDMASEAGAPTALSAELKNIPKRIAALRKGAIAQLHAEIVAMVAEYPGLVDAAIAGIVEPVRERAQYAQNVADRQRRQYLENVRRTLQGAA